MFVMPADEGDIEYEVWPFPSADAEKDAVPYKLGVAMDDAPATVVVVGWFVYLVVPPKLVAVVVAPPTLVVVVYLELIGDAALTCGTPR
jgi:hypothetical protein